jgi:thiamine biosynthesis protein ThiS
MVWNARVPAEIVVNGETIAWRSGLTITALLEQLGLDARQVAVERNLEIVSRATYGACELQPGDSLEVVTFVGGG